MATLTVPVHWPHVPLEAPRVGNPVSSGPMGDLVSQGAFLLGRNKAILGSVAGLPKANGTVSLWYIKEPGDIALLVRVMLHEGAAAGARATITASIRTTGGVDTGVGTLSGTTSRLNGTDAIECSRTDLRVPTPHERIFDVSTLTIGTQYEIRIVSASSSGTAQGIYSASAYVIPRDAMDPASAPTTEPGVSPIYTHAGNPIFAGSASTAGDVAQGTERFVKVMEDIRIKSKRWQQIATVQSTTYAWSRTNTAFGNFDWKFSGGSGVPVFYTKPKKLYTTATDNALTCIVLYSTSSGAATGTLRLTRGDATTYDVTLTGSTSFTNAAETIALSTTGSFDSWTVTGKVTAGTLYIAGIALVDSES
jgi:hypothetical protein